MMKNMEKGLTVPIWVLIVWPKIPQMPRIYLPNSHCLGMSYYVNFLEGLGSNEYHIK